MPDVENAERNVTHFSL